MNDSILPFCRVLADVRAASWKISHCYSNCYIEGIINYNVRYCYMLLLYNGWNGLELLEVNTVSQKFSHLRQQNDVQSIIIPCTW